ncbi:molybdate ABC transporter substrate-binding protein [Candidatus Parabeggiatoa sp. HSG14]|uniref:molybdate ABC transporter substrate-binding protein n=1 Tax=Candidatus Parabeggiatoa sp. HSG14 TaxID=3055593 RepID=UPI0025A8DC0D|nr:molybdate ABC transporter substrate-binding protein [Thiotrichales bacterium HSG14]
MKKPAKIALVCSLSCLMSLPVLADLNDGSFTQVDIDKAIEQGKQTCVSSPTSCGINSMPTTGNCMADYAATGQLHVPCVSVSEQFGDKTIYDIMLNQQTGSFTFDLDMDSVKPMSVLANSLTLYAAGSLKAALGDVVVSYGKTYKMKVNTKFGPSGLLRQAIEEGENPDVFASANMAHPEKLASNGWGSPVVLFARNKLCALAQPDIEVSTDNLFDVIMDEKIRVGTSTPNADPSGDYAWELFKRADEIKKDSFMTLSEKALQLTGGVNSAKAPEGRNKYGWVMSEKKADIFLTYCTNAVLAQKEVQYLKIVTIPEELSVGANYGLLVRNGTSNEAWQLAMYILSSKGQEILREYGFKTTEIEKKE